MPGKPNTSSTRPYVIKGKLIGLKALHKDDAAVATPLFQNMEMVTYLSTSRRPATVESETTFFDKLLKNEERELHLSIFELKSDRWVGGVSLRDIQPNNCATLGVVIADPKCWSRGYGSEAVRLMVEFGMFFLNLHNVRLGYFGYNARARRAYEKAGFKEVGRFRGTIVLAGQRYDDVWMDITRNEVDLSRMWKLVPMISPAGDARAFPR